MESHDRAIAAFLDELVVQHPLSPRFSELCATLEVVALAEERAVQQVLGEIAQVGSAKLEPDRLETLTVDLQGMTAALSLAADPAGESPRTRSWRPFVRKRDGAGSSGAVSGVATGAVIQRIAATLSELRDGMVWHEVGLNRGTTALASAAEDLAAALARLAPIALRIEETAREIGATDPVLKGALESEALGPLQRRRRDLAELLAVAQQATVGIDLVAVNFHALAESVNAAIGAVGLAIRTAREIERASEQRRIAEDEARRRGKAIAALDGLGRGAGVRIEPGNSGPSAASLVGLQSYLASVRTDLSGLDRTQANLARLLPGN